MIRMVKTRNGDVIEITSGDAYSGPGDCYSKLRVNTTTAWIRVHPSTKWLRSTERSECLTRLGIEECETAEDVVRIMARTT